MSLKVYIGGKYYDKADAKISVYDHGLLYGDGVFEGIRAYGGRVFRLAQHLDRLYDSARSIHLQVPMAKEQLAEAVRETVATNNLTDAYIRLVVTRGAGSLGLDPRKTTDPQVIIIADSITLYPDGTVRARPQDRHRRDDPQPPRGAQPADQVAELPEQHPGEDRGHERRLSRSPDAQPSRRGRRVHRRQHLHRPSR